MSRDFWVTYDFETDGRTIASVEGIPGCSAYGDTREEAREKVLVLAREAVEEMRSGGSGEGQHEDPELFGELDELFEELKDGGEPRPGSRGGRIELAEFLEGVASEDEIRAELEAARSAASASTPVPRPGAPRTPPVRHRYANRRGGLHGILALERVISSDVLRGMALRRRGREELEEELRRREFARGREESETRFLRRAARAVLSALIQEFGSGERDGR